MDLTPDFSEVRIATPSPPPYPDLGHVHDEVRVIHVEDMPEYWRVSIEAPYVTEERSRDSFYHEFYYESGDEDIDQFAIGEGYNRANTDVYEEGHYYRVDNLSHVFHCRLSKTVCPTRLDLDRYLENWPVTQTNVQWEITPPRNWLALRTDLWPI
jgi:hypothetical protein